MIISSGSKNSPMIYLSIVSHAHFDLIKEIGCLIKFKESTRLKIIIRDNVGELGFKNWCDSLGFRYSCNEKQCGFGENNNLNFLQAQLDGCSDEDYFLLFNPDVECSEENIVKLADRMTENKLGLATLNLFLDKDFVEMDSCARKFPSLWNFISSYLLGVNGSIIDKARLDNVSIVDWVAGSFMMFRTSNYKRLNGFDEKYFMYCEDIDICWRFHQEFGSKVVLFKDIYAVHYARKNNRKMFSIHFLWHLKGCIRYLLR